MKWVFVILYFFLGALLPAFGQGIHLHIPRVAQISSSFFVLQLRGDSLDANNLSRVKTLGIRQIDIYRSFSGRPKSLNGTRIIENGHIQFAQDYILSNILPRFSKYDKHGRLIYMNRYPLAFWYSYKNHCLDKTIVGTSLSNGTVTDSLDSIIKYFYEKDRLAEIEITDGKTNSIFTRHLFFYEGNQIVREVLLVRNDTLNYYFHYNTQNQLVKITMDEEGNYVEFTYDEKTGKMVQDVHFEDGKEVLRLQYEFDWDGLLVGYRVIDHLRNTTSYYTFEYR